MIQYNYTRLLIVARVHRKLGCASESMSFGLNICVPNMRALPRCIRLGIGTESSRQTIGKVAEALEPGDLGFQKHDILPIHLGLAFDRVR